LGELALFLALASILAYALFTLPQRLLLHHLLPSRDSHFPITPSPQVIAANALTAIVLLALLLLVRNRATK